MTHTYPEQLAILKPIKLKEGQYLRIDCPFCGGNNSFGISRVAGVISWNCFKASCGCHGRKTAGYTREGIKVKLGLDSIRASANEPEPKIPEPLLPIDDSILAWLGKVHSLEAYTQGLVNIQYSPSEDRVLFKIPDKNGYVGRAMWAVNSNPPSQIWGPKWKKYGDTSSVFTCGNGEVGVIVEDAPSACAVGVVEGYTGVALLGTMLTTQHKIALKGFKRLIVCLDPDAAIKSITLARRLQGIVHTSVKLIPDDLKFFNADEIRSILCT